MAKNKKTKMAELLNQLGVKIPKIGDLVEGKVIEIGKNEVRIDIEGLTTGVVRGPELFDESQEYSKLKIGDIVQATVIDLENEKGEMELSFRYVGHKKAWANLEKIFQENKTIKAKVVEANKGGLMVKVGEILGFLPASQLSSEHYPRVEGGDKKKILEKLKKLVGQELEVKILSLSEEEGILILSEKMAKKEEEKEKIAQYKVGDVVKGEIVGVADFGAFIEFGPKIIGLIHISELAWQRIEHPKDIVKVGDVVKAQIIEIENSKISLSLKRLKEDPWQKVEEKYQVGQIVKGRILKINPFGLFVELDKDIHGLAHVSELSNLDLKTVKVGDILDFKIISLEPEEHRLGLSLKIN